MNSEMLMNVLRDRRLSYVSAEVQWIYFSDKDILTASDGTPEDDNSVWTPWF